MGLRLDRLGGVTRLVLCLVSSPCPNTHLQWDGDYSMDEGHCPALQGCWRPFSCSKMDERQVTSYPPRVVKETLLLTAGTAQCKV